ncbi:hypothetical protein FS749_004481 [Ceratobasidium sp. UAMH 11750]|nr:hypothetical protein FS749_004481 [Ceratobasidium sp. UAMH 11750]
MELAQVSSNRWTYNRSTRLKGALNLGEQKAGKWGTEDVVAAATASGFRSITKYWHARMNSNPSISSTKPTSFDKI